MNKYKYRLTIITFGILSALSAVLAGITGNLIFYTSFTTFRYLGEGLFSWRVSRKIPLVLILGLSINLIAVISGKNQLAFISSAAFSFNSILISWKVLSDNSEIRSTP